LFDDNVGITISSMNDQSQDDRKNDDGQDEK